MNQVKLSKFEKCDAKFIQENFSFAFRDSSIENIENIINSWKRTLGFCILFEDIKVGFIVLTDKNDGKLSFGVSVKEDFRGKGIASKAFELIKNKAKSMNYSSIISSCDKQNKASVNLHKKLGFNLVKTETNQSGFEMHRWEMMI